MLLNECDVIRAPNQVMVDPLSVLDGMGTFGAIDSMPRHPGEAADPTCQMYGLGDDPSCRECSLQETMLAVGQLPVGCQTLLGEALGSAESARDIDIEAACPCYLQHPIPEEIPQCYPFPGIYPLKFAYSSCKALQASASAPAPAPTPAPAPAPAPARVVTAVTNTVRPVLAGAQSIELEDVSGITEGDQMEIGNGGTAETATVASVTLTIARRVRRAAGTVGFEEALQFSHAAGATVTFSTVTADSSKGTNAEQPALTYHMSKLALAAIPVALVAFFLYDANVFNAAN